MDAVKNHHGWEFVEAGWWTHPTLGGIVKRGRKWECYRREIFICPIHTEKTLDAAMRWIEKQHSKKKG